MRRLIPFIAILSLTLVALVSFAQSMFGYGNTPSTTNNQSSSAKGNNPVKRATPDDFKKNVTAIDKQTKTQLKDEFNQQLAAKPPIPLQQPATPPASSGPLIGPSTTNTVNQPPPRLPQQPTQIPTQVAPSAQTPPAQTAQTAQQPAQTGGANTSIYNRPQTPDSQIYTGFPAQKNSNQNNNSSTQQQQQQQGGGWNINY